jgi:hypothetical protein
LFSLSPSPLILGTSHLKQNKIINKQLSVYIIIMTEHGMTFISNKINVDNFFKV